MKYDDAPAILICIFIIVVTVTMLLTKPSKCDFGVEQFNLGVGWVCVAGYKIEHE